MKATLEERKLNFLRRAKDSLRPDDVLDFSKVEYVNDRTPITVIDKGLRPDGTEYGEFLITPSNFLKGRRHPDRRAARISASKRTSKENIVNRFKETHPDELLDYSEMEYKGMHTPVKIISHDLRPDDTEYGEFWQQPCVHLRGGSHPDIARDKRRGRFLISDEVFRRRLAEIFDGEPYDYRFTRYSGRKGFAGIICGIHGPFVRKIEELYNGKGCPQCSTLDSSAEEEIYRFLVQAVGVGAVQCHVKDIVEGQELDFYLPDYALAIEYNGLRWHSERVGRDMIYHLKKTMACNKEGIRLIHIFEDEFVKRKDIVRAKVLRCLGLGFNARPSAEHCEVKRITEDDARRFADSYHLRGYEAATTHYGVFYGNVLVGMMSFTSVDQNAEKWALTRFVEHHEYLVDGLFDVLFAAFLVENSVKEVWTILDCCWDGQDEGQMLRGVGFILNDYIPPVSRYTDGHRERLSANEVSGRSDGWRFHRIWNCGFMRYVYRTDG